MAQDTSTTTKTKAPEPVAAKKKLILGLSPEEMAGAAVGQGAALADELTTEHNLRGGAQEHDPLAKPFTELPEPAYLASGAAMAGALTAIAHKMRESKHPLARAVGKIAQDVQIGLNAGNAANNAEHPPAASGPRTPHRLGVPHAENERHDHPVIAAAGGMKGEPAPVLLGKLNSHIANMDQDNLADAAAKFGITSADTLQSATAKLRGALSAPVAA
jgi:hypothetical protein